MNHHDPSRNIFDDYDTLNAYYKLLAIPGRHFQAREFNVVQSMLLDLIKRLGNTIFRDGNIVEGCPITVTGTVVTIGEGKIYYDGIILDTLGDVLEITASGEENIGVKLEETIVDYTEDDRLLDPAVGHSSYLHPGCKRVKKNLVFTVNDPLAATMVKLTDGQIQQLVTEAPVMDTMELVLARRTFDESGNYVVRGLEIMDPQYSTENEIYVGLSKGKAYIKGFEVQKPADTSFPVPKSLTFREVLGEPKLVTTATNDYSVINNPVKSINRVFVTAEYTETVNRGPVSGTADALTQTPVLAITEIKQSSTSYLPGVDFILNNNTIDWSPGGKEPVTGTNYTVKYQYKTALRADTDFQVITKDNRTIIRFLTGKVVPGTEFLIDYDYYLARKDTICIDKDGQVIVIEGAPNDLANVIAPKVTDEALLRIGEVTILPNSDKMTKLNSTIRVSTMERIQNTIKRVEDLEYNQSITDLDNEAMEGEAATELKGIFTDGFLNFNKVDVTYGNVDYSLDVEQGTLNLPFNEYDTPMSIGTFSKNAYATLGNVYCNRYNEVVALDQPYTTQSMLVNPYQVFEPIMTIQIDPQVDNWVDSEKITVENVNTTATNLRKWWSHPDEDWAQEEKRLWEMMGFTGGVGTNGDWSDFGNGADSNWLVHYSNQHVTGTSSSVLEEAILYMRSISVKVSSLTFEKFEDNIKCKIDGREVALTPLGTTTRGTQPGSVKADSNGAVNASFTIPPGIPCGTKEVELYSPQYSGTTTYTAEGRRRVETETIFIQRNVVHATDPLAQIFQVDATCNITSVDVFFANVDVTCPVTVQLRGTTNGYPNNTLYGECTLAGYSLKSSTDGTAPTRFAFPNVIKCEKDELYSIVVMTDSPRTSLFVAKLGDRDLSLGKYLTANPYTAGVLFSSSNALTWTPHQDMDMKFTLYRAEYERDGYIQFNSLTPSEADRLMLCLEHVQPAGTTINFEVSLNGADFIPCYPWMDREFDYAIYKADYRITMTSDGYQSPLIAKDTARLISWANKDKAVYVSRTVFLPDSYSDIKVYFDSKIVAGSTYKVFYSTDATADVWVEMTSPEVTPLSEEWQQNYYHVELDDEFNTYRVKLEMTTAVKGRRPKIKRFMNILRIL